MTWWAHKLSNNCGPAIASAEGAGDYALLIGKGYFLPFPHPGDER